MKTRALTLSTICFLILIYSCSISRKAEVKEQENTHSTEEPGERENEVEFYVCQGDTIEIKDYLPGTNKSWQYHSIMTCLNETGCYGDVEANKELAKIITKTGYEGLRFFRSEFPTSRLRGKDIFVAILNLGPDDTPDYGFDGYPHWSKTMTFKAIEYLIALIETIDGNKNIPIYIHSKNKNFAKGMTEIDKIYIARDRAYYNTIKQAWNDGLIVLKPYYNK